MKSKTISTCSRRGLSRFSRQRKWDCPFKAAPQFFGQRFGLLFIPAEFIGVIDAAGDQGGPQRREFIEPAVGGIGKEAFFQGVLAVRRETASGFRCRCKAATIGRGQGDGEQRQDDGQSTSHGLPARFCRLCESFRRRSDFRRRDDARLRQL